MPEMQRLRVVVVAAAAHHHMTAAVILLLLDEPLVPVELVLELLVEVHTPRVDILV